MNLAGAVRYWAARDPDRMAFAMGARELTWRQLDERTSRLASGLQAAGVSTGDRVAALTPNCIEFCETVIACFKLGAIFVPLNYRLAPPELTDILHRSGARLLVAERDLLDHLLAFDPAVPGRITCVVVAGPRQGELDFSALIDGSDPADPGAIFPPEHPAFICYTSGTTGLPKGAVLSHRNVLATALERAVCDGWTSIDTGFIPYAIAFTGGLVSMWMPLYVMGAGTVLEPAFDPEVALRIIAGRRVTAFIAVGSVLEALAAAPGFASADLSSLTTAATGGQAISPELIRKFARKGINLAQQYGITEGGGLNIVLPPREAMSRIGSAGLPTPQCQVRVARPDGAECDTGEVGELLLMGPQIMERYWEDPVSTAETLVGGWLHTGDLVRRDDEGYLYIVDRKKDMLISGGLNVYPAEIERVLADLPGLLEFAVIGVPDPRWGEVPAVIARAEPSLTAADLIEFCAGRLARYKIPRQIILREDPLPRGMSNKVLKRELREQYARAIADQGAAS
jgi:fatty-acyl-CoA synthase